MDGMADISLTRNGVRVDREIHYQDTDARKKLKKEEDFEPTDKIKKFVFLKKAGIDEATGMILDMGAYLEDRGRQTNDALEIVIKQVKDFLTDSEALVKSVIDGSDDVAKLMDSIDKMNKIEQQLDWACSTLDLNYDSFQTIDKVRKAFEKIQEVFKRTLTEYRKEV